MKKIVIVGAGGFGRELLWWIQDINKIEQKWEIKGFIDDNLYALDSFNYDYKIIGTISDYMPQDDEELALAIASPALKRKIVKMLKEKGAHFATIIHPTAMIHETAKIGEGFISFPNSKVSCNSVVGDFVTLLSTLIGHDTIIGEYSTISGGCNVVRNVNIGKGVFLAAGVCIAQDVVVGDNAYLGLGSVILKNVDANTTVFGNPARKVPMN